MSMQLGSFRVGLAQPFFLIAGPCVIEGAESTFAIAKRLREITSELGLSFIFKASFDKANRTSHNSFRGIGFEEGLDVLAHIKDELGVNVLTDIHEVSQVERVASCVDVLQVPALLSRQTDLLQAAAATGKPVMIKKGQFMAPDDMVHAVAKFRDVAAESKVLVCERGSSFGYRNLVVDMRSLAIMRRTGCPVVFDATHSVQLPGGMGHASAGEPHFVPVLARAAVSVGISGLFLETHPHPERALSDGANAWPLDRMHHLLQSLQAIDRCVKQGQGIGNECQ
jgi:2-dehydro-3-deoxyphosphooctonate aldolase (KDO 8-P synthase)